MPQDELLQLIQKAAEDKVTSLNHSFERLTCLPAAIRQLTNLTSLDFANNSDDDSTVIPIYQ